MAEGYLVGTSVFLRWFVEQDGYEHAREIQHVFVEGQVGLETVDFARVEVAEVLRKKGLLPGRLDREMFMAAIRVIDDLDVIVHSIDADRLHGACDLAIDHSLRMFDALFVQVALERKLPLLTADAKLCRAVDGLIETEVLRGVNGA